MVLQLEHVTKFYKYDKNKQIVIKDLSIRFPVRGLVAIVGQSGSGKSTLLNLIAGIEKPNHGKIIIDGYKLDYGKLNEYQFNYISYVYQFYNLVDSLTVRENIILLAKIKGKKNLVNKLELFAHKLQIKTFLDKFPKELSGGQKQRVALARAFLCDTPILLADEPTGALNNKMAVEIMKLLKWYARKHLVIVISHNYPLIKKYTKMIIDLNSEQDIYDFYPRVNYHKYFFNINNVTGKINFYLKRQIIYQKNKIIMMFCSQIFAICAFVLLVSGVNGGWQYLQKNFNSDPLKEIIEISKKDYQEIYFTQEQFTKFKNDVLIREMDYKLDFSYGDFFYGKELKLTGYQIYQSSYLDFFKGNYPSKLNEVIINRETSDKYALKLKDKIDFILGQQKYSLTICGIVNDYVNNGANIYFDSKLIDLNIYNNLLNKSSLVIQSGEFDKIIEKYDKDYFIVNLHQDYLDSYQILFEMALMAVGCFLIVSFIISIILISIILKTILIERKKDICLMLVNGLSLKQARGLFSKETTIIGIIIGLLGSLLSWLILVIINIFKLSERFFEINNLFVLPKLFFFKYDLFILMVLIYGISCSLIGIFTSLKISKMDMSVLLKED